MFAALPGQLNNPGIIRNVRQIRLICTGRKQANLRKLNLCDNKVLSVLNVKNEELGLPGLPRHSTTKFKFSFF